MIKLQNKDKKTKRETKRSSLVARWVSIVVLTITVSFVVFSFVIYSSVSQQSLRQQQETSASVVDLFQRRLGSIDQELSIANVVPSLSPSTRRILDGKPVIDSQKNAGSAFNDSLVSLMSNPDIKVAVYNLHETAVFSNADTAPKLIKTQKDSYSQIVSKKRGQKLYNVAQIHSARNGRLTGYLVVVNEMTNYNRLMMNLLQLMIIISVVAVIIFSLVAYLVVRSIVNPLKQMSEVAQKVNQDPNSTVRINELHRSDELEELAHSFNQMLDRMQSYIEQQKQFVSDVSHELRTPVAVIEGHLSMLQRWGKDDPKILNESINASLQEAERMKHLIQEMLDLTRAEQINVQYPNEVTQVDEVLDRVVSDMRLVHPDFNIQLEDSDLPRGSKIQIYRGHLEQLLIILIDNAIKYSTNRKEVIVSAGVSEDKLQMMVQDFGEGISDKEKAKIFNRFYRVDKARTREKGGNGLGLAIAYKLTKSYSGNINVESVEGQGSQFKIEFPLLTPTQVAILEEKAAQKRK